MKRCPNIDSSTPFESFLREVLPAAALLTPLWVSQVVEAGARDSSSGACPDPTCPSRVVDDLFGPDAAATTNPVLPLPPEENSKTMESSAAEKQAILIFFDSFL